MNPRKCQQVWWIDSSQQPSTHTAACSLQLPEGQGKRIGRAKVRKLVAWDKNNLTSERKRKINWCKSNYSAPPTIRLMPSRCPSNGLIGRQNASPSSSTSRFYCWAWSYMMWKISLSPIWVSCPSCVSSQLLAHPHQTHWGKQSATLFSNSQNIGVLWTLF